MSASSPQENEHSELSCFKTYRYKSNSSYGFVTLSFAHAQNLGRDNRSLALKDDTFFAFYRFGAGKFF